LTQIFELILFISVTSSSF